MGILGAASAAWWKTPPNEKRRAPEPATPLQRAPRPEQPEATTDGSCRLTKAAQRLSPSIVLSIPPNVAVDPVQGHAAIGFADTPTDGLGIIVDPSTLLAGHVFRNHSRSDVLGVVPVTSSGRLDFVVTGSDTGFDTARAVDAKVPFALGYRNGDFVRFSNDAHETVWSNVAHQRVTEPRVATVTGFGHVVTFRSDGQEGTIRYGWLTPDGHKKTDLASLSVHGRVGTPAIAAQQGATLTAFAVRSEAEPTWHIELALAHGDGPPESTHRFSLPQGGPGQEAMSPVAEALSHGRWILQWTEGPAGRRDVRIQALSQDLKTMGPAITVSPKNANAGQGVVWVSGKKALSTFLVASQHSHELWGTALECP